MRTPAMKKQPQPLPTHAVSEAEGLVRTRQPQPASAGRDTVPPVTCPKGNQYE